MTPPKATPNRKGKVCKPKDDILEAFDEYSNLPDNWEQLLEKRTSNEKIIIDFRTINKNN